MKFAFFLYIHVLTVVMNLLVHRLNRVANINVKLVWAVSRLPPLTLLDLSHLLVSVYLPFAALSALGLFANRIDCGMSHLAADRQSTFCIDLTIHERALLLTLRGRI